MRVAGDPWSTATGSEATPTVTGTGIEQASIVRREFVFPAGAAAPACHASTIAEGKPGEFVVAWFGGTAEGHPDVGIWTARWIDGRWTKPVEVATGVAPDGTRYPCWNPVLFQIPDGDLLLFSKVGPSPSTWWGVVRRSSDAGATWSEPERLSRDGTGIKGGPVGPIKNKPVAIGAGVILAPSSTEDDGWRVHFERSADGGRTWDVIGPVNDGKEIAAIQPSILKLGGTRLLAIGRTRNHHLFQIESPDDGVTWGPMTLTDLPNSGTVTLETAPGEYSYPAIIQASDGLVHATYTWNRKLVAHVVIDPRRLTTAVQPAAPPGVVIDHVPAKTKTYVGSPSIAILPDGTYVAAHDFFGPGSSEWRSAVTDVFTSADRGATWSKASRINGAFWSNLFVHRGSLYLMGPTRHHGPLVIRRSTDGGHSWTTPADATTGLLAEGEYHTAPMPMLVHSGRLWRAIEDASGGKEWGKRYMALMVSAPVEAQLLDRASWTFSNAIPRDAAWLDGTFTGWLEGNAVAAADGRVFDILRVEAGTIEKAAMVSISVDGKRAEFDPQAGFIDLPGAATKFAIRRDPRSESGDATPVWWMLSNAAAPAHAAKKDWSRLRNTLVLFRSVDLRTWERRSVVLHHPDRTKHAFQYVDWLFDGEDIVAVSRTAFDDPEGGSHGFHDANYLTFHRFENFRRLLPADSIVDPKSLGW